MADRIISLNCIDSSRRPSFLSQYAFSLSSRSQDFRVYKDIESLHDLVAQFSCLLSEVLHWFLERFLVSSKLLLEGMYMVVTSGSPQCERTDYSAQTS